MNNKKFYNQIINNETMETLKQGVYQSTWMCKKYVDKDGVEKVLKFKTKVKVEDDFSQIENEYNAFEFYKRVTDIIIKYMNNYDIPFFTRLLTQKKQYFDDYNDLMHNILVFCLENDINENNLYNVVDEYEDKNGNLKQVTNQSLVFDYVKKLYYKDKMNYCLSIEDLTSRNDKDGNDYTNELLFAYYIDDENDTKNIDDELLTDLEKQILNMKYVEKLTLKEISKELKINVSSVATKISRIRKILQKKYNYTIGA